MLQLIGETSRPDSCANADMTSNGYTAVSLLRTDLPDRGIRASAQYRRHFADRPVFAGTTPCSTYNGAAWDSCLSQKKNCTTPGV